MTAESPLGPEWVRSPDDGRYFRRAARVLLLDEQDRVLLVRGHDVDRPERSWWFTIGGGIDADETAEQAAVREVAEETGLQISEADLRGPVLTREAIFDFEAEHVRQDEVFYYARIHDAGEISRDGWTAVEQSFMDEVAWWTAEDLRAVDLEVFPQELADVVASVAGGWDGTVRHLGLQDDDASGEAVPQ
ncbi:NUDIX hydrolase [Pseudactinotalea sp.]|uniref:NUDIX hydrolase n=1 Tax=Pseudactinotalea sp. TaxID=1926260 RepID=UPI003B3A6470